MKFDNTDIGPQAHTSSVQYSSVEETAMDQIILSSDLRAADGTLQDTRTSDEMSTSAFTTSGVSWSTNPTAEELMRLDSASNDALGSSSKEEFLAFGTIELRLSAENGSEPQLMMQSPAGNEPYPSPLISMAMRKGWLCFEAMRSKEEIFEHRLRVYILPEDVDRGSRGSLKDFRKVVKHVLRFVNRSVDAWQGGSDESGDHIPYEVPKSSQEESLFYIFNTLQSPCPNLQNFRTSTYEYEAIKNALNSSILGLKTELYPYQRRSIAAMIQRECQPSKILDPRKPIAKDMYGRPFYLDVNEGAVLRDPLLYTEPQGGILAETMGYGKTLICIALILATRGHYPKVPEDRVDSIPVRTRPKVGSLLAMAARRTKHEGIPWKAEFYALGKAGYEYNRCIEELKKYERQYAEPIFTPTTPDRKGKRDSANVVRICSATLIIVPPNLLIQWQHEINKHTEKDALDVLVVDTPAKQIPPWKELVTYDIVLITKARFEQEYRDDDLHQGKVRKGEDRYRSSLTDVRWLRVICDEGHGFAGSSSRTNAMAMLDKMYIERRWVVSGTPSSTLHGVEVGLSSTTSSSIEHTAKPDISDPTTARKISLQSALQKRRAPSARELESKDLERLRLIVVNFLRLQPWANQRGSSDVANWRKYLGPLVDAGGSRFTSPALRDVLQTLILRHRIEDIDTDLTLPPLHNNIVYLDPSYHDKLAINMFYLVLASNYVTSEREDEDYMFHPRNRKKLDQLINNLRQASFHWVGFSEHDIRETLRISNEYLDKNIDCISDVDGILLTEAIMNGERALADLSWKAFANLHEIGVYINHFPEHARESWALDGRGDNPTLLGTVQAREAQRYLRQKLEENADDVLTSFAGAGVRVMNAAKNRAEEERRTQQDSKIKLNENEKQQVGTVEEPKLKSSTASLASPGRMSRNKHSSSTTPKKRRRSSSTMTSSLITPPSSPNTTLLVPPSHSSMSAALSNTAISSFTSSKLTYLISRLLALPPSTKSLVFYQHNNTAFFIAEALELLSISFRIYANTLSVGQRNSYLADFNSDTSDIQVLLMDVKQASHGLHVACASYVCIVSPIWDAGVESQAIKRAHRIGQTKEVIVETLVLKNTFEEEMVRRRKWKDEHLELDNEVINAQATIEDHIDLDMPSTSVGVTEAASGKPLNATTGRGLLDDRHMVNVIKDLKFLKFSREECEITGRVTEMNVPPEKRMLLGQCAIHEKTAVAQDGRQTCKEDVTLDTKESIVDSRELHVQFKKRRIRSSSEGRVNGAQ